MRSTRREVLQQAAAAAVACGAAPARSAQQAAPIVDPHLHLWDLTRFRLPWLEAGSALARSYVMRDYLDATTGLNVVKAVYMEVDVEPGQQVAEAEYVLDLCQ